MSTACLLVGDVALIRGGKLNRIGANGPYQFSDSDQFGIVSDTYVKWRGGKVPTLEEEPKVRASANCAKLADSVQTQAHEFHR